MFFDPTAFDGVEGFVTAGLELLEVLGAAFCTTGGDLIVDGLLYAGFEAGFGAAALDGAGFVDTAFGAGAALGLDGAGRAFFAVGFDLGAL